MPGHKIDHVCPKCGRVKEHVEQVAGPVGAPTVDGFSVVICDRCGEITLLGPDGPKIPTALVLSQIVESMPRDVLGRVEALRGERWVHFLGRFERANVVP